MINALNEQKVSFINRPKFGFTVHSVGYEGNDGIRACGILPAAPLL